MRQERKNTITQNKLQQLKSPGLVDHILCSSTTGLQTKGTLLRLRRLSDSITQKSKYEMIST